MATRQTSCETRCSRRLQPAGSSSRPDRSFGTLTKEMVGIKVFCCRSSRGVWPTYFPTNAVRGAYWRLGSLENTGFNGRQHHNSRGSGESALLDTRPRKDKCRCDTFTTWPHSLISEVNSWVCSLSESNTTPCMRWHAITTSLAQIKTKKKFSPFRCCCGKLWKDYSC